MSHNTADQSRGSLASSSEFFRYDQVAKADYHLAEAADSDDAFDDDYRFEVCDLSQFTHGSEAERAAFADQLGTAMHESGFAILVGHGVDPALFEQAEQWVTDLFTSASLDAKLAFRAARRGAVSEGYFPVHTTSDIHPDLVEGWVFGRVAYDINNDGDFDAAAHWVDPSHEPLFRRLIEAQTPLFGPIMSAILTYLGCDPDTFADRLATPEFGQRLNYYAPMSADELGRRAGRLLGHEDVDLFTLLPAPSVEGLQVLVRSGKWVRMNAPAGSIILNTGDYLQRISNDILPSTTHRVSPPRDPDDALRARVSFPLAAYLPADDMLEVLPGIANPKYDPIKVLAFHTRTTAKFYGDDYAVG
jgi:isopenicillin N synthase-like dioxygenase